MGTKEFEKRKWSFAHICAYLSLAISLTMLVLWCCNVGGFEVVSLDSFVGVIVTLLAIIVAVAIGYQIYNGIGLNAKLEELDVIKEKLIAQEKNITQKDCKSRHLISVSLAEIEFNKREYITAFSYLMASLEFTMELDTPTNVENVFQRMIFSISKMPSGTLCPSETMKAIQDSDKGIKSSHCYSIIKIQYEKIYKDFISKIVNEDKNE